MAQSPALRILLVEDHADTLQRLLELDGHVVITANSFVAATRLVGRHSFDLLVSDIQLRDGSGWTLMQQVRERCPGVQGIAVTGHAYAHDVERSKAAGFCLHLAKPLDFAALQNVRNVRASRVQCDEIWSFCYAKQKNVPEELRGAFGYGDVWTWTALDADSKLIISYLVGGRDAGYANEFVNDLAGRLANRVQLTTDGHKAYLDAVEDAFGGDIDYAQLVKLYGNEPKPGEARYSPAECIGCRKHEISGEPDIKHVSTSYVERSNLTMRMMNRRFTRLTNAFSKKIENHMHAVTLYVMHYNFCRIHKTLRVTPAMEAKLSDHVWEIEELVALIK